MQRRGFTLIEVLVVIGIIVILVSIVIAVGAAVRSSSQRSQTMSMLRILDGLYAHYRDTTNNDMSFALNHATTSPYPVDPYVTLQQFLFSASKFPDMNKTLLAFGSAYTPASSNYVEQMGGTPSVGDPPSLIDAFGNPMAMVVYSDNSGPKAFSWNPGVLMPRAPYFRSDGPIPDSPYTNTTWVDDLFSYNAQ
jgi:prepilin-type N-terminal cleavage/methylation domain-containing protein